MMNREMRLSRPNPTVQIPPWDPYDDPVTAPFSAVNFNGNATSPGDYPHSPSPFLDSFPSLQRYLPSNEFDSLSDDVESPDMPIDVFSCEEFRMYEFKVRRCARGRAHDWTDCPFVHPGEKARRRDPRKYHYSGTACPEFRKGSCRKADACEYAHGVFEYWLHPDRYRTQPCKDGTSCRRRVCFFAHTPEQLRILPQQDPFLGDVSCELEFESPLRRRHESYSTKPYVSSPTSILMSPPISPPSESPPMSPSGYSPLGYGSYNSASELIVSMRKLQLERAKVGSGLLMGSGFGSSRCSMLRPEFNGTLTTPSRKPNRSGLGGFDNWNSAACNEEPVMERVESGKELRAEMYARLSKENSLDRVGSVTTCPDVGWVSE